MIRLYFKNKTVPSYLFTVTGELIPHVTFDSVVVVWKWKGVYYIKLLWGKSVIKISNGVKVT